jgi:hypothetical protein
MLALATGNSICIADEQADVAASPSSSDASLASLRSGALPSITVARASEALEASLCDASTEVASSPPASSTTN